MNQREGGWNINRRPDGRVSSYEFKRPGEMRVIFEESELEGEPNVWSQLFGPEVPPPWTQQTERRPEDSEGSDEAPEGSEEAPSRTSPSEESARHAELQRAQNRTHKQHDKAELEQHLEAALERECADKAEISRLRARIEELEAELKEVSGAARKELSQVQEGAAVEQEGLNDPPQGLEGDPEQNHEGAAEEHEGHDNEPQGLQDQDNANGRVVKIERAVVKHEGLNDQLHSLEHEVESLRRAQHEHAKDPGAHGNIVKVEEVRVVKQETDLDDQLKSLEGTVEELRRAQEQNTQVAHGKKRPRADD